ncbi:MAG: arginase family protein [Actinomycetales bacterium]|jgi:arginase|nr:arginase family protein [Actinomycetales bacterium]
MADDTSPRRGWGVLGVPSSAAAHWPGLEKGPRALREAGLVEAMRSAGLSVVDHGDRTEARFRAARSSDEPNDVARVVEVVRDAADAIGEIVAAGRRPLVLGGECTLAISLVSAFAAAGREVGVVYVDGGQDLQLPGDHPDEPILDSMGMAHLLDLPGAVDALAGVGPVRPLLTPDRVCFYGFAEEDEDVHGLVPSLRFTAGDVTADPVATAVHAAEAASRARDGFVVHLDVDVLDYLLLPAADVPQYGRGLRVATLVQALGILAARPEFAGMTVVEFNPDHAAADGSTAREVVRAVVSILAHARR